MKTKTKPIRTAWRPVTKNLSNVWKDRNQNVWFSSMIVQYHARCNQRTSTKTQIEKPSPQGAAFDFLVCKQIPGLRQMFAIDH